MSTPCIPGYRIERRLARGGMAVVFLAIQESLERPVALKILSNPGDEEFAQRFLNEGRIVASLSHRNIITVHDVGVAGSLHYLAMEFIEGGDLKSRIAQGLPLELALSLIEQLADCLDCAHRRGVIHRDIKPANILFRADGTPVLTDFGIAKHAGSDLTVAGTVLGSPYYLSPEQAQGKPVDGRSDIYSLGIILFEMLTGKKPYVADSEIDTIVKQIQAPVPQLPPGCGGYQDLLNRMLAKAPEQRFASASELSEYVRALRSGGNIRARESSAQLAPVPPPTPAPQKLAPPSAPRSKAMVLGTLGLIVLAVLIGLGVRHGAPAATPPRTAPLAAQSEIFPDATDTPLEARAPQLEGASPESLFEAALSYRQGVGHPSDDQRALGLFQQAAAQGHPGAQYYLGLIYAQGRGVSIDREQAVSWLEKAALQNVVDAQYLLCLAYALGRGATPDRVMAYAWGEVARRQGSREAHEALGTIRQFLAPPKIKAAMNVAVKLMNQIGGRPPVLIDDSPAPQALDSITAR